MIVARIIAPRRYCSDHTCGGTDCLTCYGAHAEVLVELRVDGVALHDERVAELLERDDPDVCAAVARALGGVSTPAPTPAPSFAKDDALPF